MSARQETTVARNANGTGRRWRLVRARRDAVPDSLRRAQRRFRRPSRSWLRPVLYVAISAVALGLLGWVLYGTSLLGVREISVSGSHISGPDAVRAAAAVPLGTPLARLDIDEVADRIRALPSVGGRVHVVRDAVLVDLTGYALLRLGQILRPQLGRGREFRPWVAQDAVGPHLVEVPVGHDVIWRQRKPRHNWVRRSNV